MMENNDALISEDKGDTQGVDNDNNQQQYKAIMECWPHTPRILNH